METTTVKVSSTLLRMNESYVDIRRSEREGPGKRLEVVITEALKKERAIKQREQTEWKERKQQSGNDSKKLPP